MFAQIETNGATSILIHIPHAGSDKTLPALAAMLEQNAVFVQGGYREFNLIKPTMSIHLGNTFKVTHGDVEMEVLAPDTPAVIGDTFAVATPQVIVSNAQAMTKLRGERDQLRTEVDYLKKSLDRANEQLKALTETEPE